MLFTGESELTIDAKQRLLIPAKYRQQMEAAGAGAGWYSVVLAAGILRLYPAALFEAMAAQTDPSLTPDEVDAEFDVAFFSGAEWIEMDSAGRLTLPRQHVEGATLPSEVVVIGARHRLEVRNRAEWQAGAAARRAKLPTLMQVVESRRVRDGAPKAPPGAANAGGNS